MNISVAMFYEIIWHRISIQTLLFQACLPTRQNGVENYDKAYFTGRLMNFIKNRNQHSGLKNFKIITATFIVESLGFISFALMIARL